MNQQQIKTAVEALWDKARTLYPNLPVQAPTVGFYDRGAAAGRAHIKRHHVEFNTVLAAQNAEAFNNTVSHEVAHIAQYIMFPRSQPHGREFKMIHRQLGGSGTTYHSYNVLMVKRFRKGSGVFTCSCPDRQHVLSPEKTIKHLFYGNFKCTACGGKLKYSGTVEQVKQKMLDNSVQPAV